MNNMITFFQPSKRNLLNEIENLYDEIFAIERQIANESDRIRLRYLRRQHEIKIAIRSQKQAQASRMIF